MTTKAKQIICETCNAKAEIFFGLAGGKTVDGYDMLPSWWKLCRQCYERETARMPQCDRLMLLPLTPEHIPYIDSWIAAAEEMLRAAGVASAAPADAGGTKKSKEVERAMALLRDEGIVFFVHDKGDPRWANYRG